MSQECDRLEAQLEALRQSQTSAEDANALNAELESLRQQLVASQGQAQSLEQEFQVLALELDLNEPERTAHIEHMHSLVFRTVLVLLSVI